MPFMRQAVALLMNSRKTGTVSSAPPKELTSSPSVRRRAAAPFALLSAFALATQAADSVHAIRG